MKKMNNKGFAITSIIYGLMLLFILAVTSLLSILVGRNRRMDELVEGVYDSLKYPEFNITYSETDNKFSIDGVVQTNEGILITEKRGKYDFSSLGTSYANCVLYLPKNVVITTSEFKTIGTGLTKLYYSIDGGEDIDNYKELCPTFAS